MIAKLLSATTFWLFWCTLIGIIESFILHGRLDLKYLALWIIGGILISIGIHYFQSSHNLFLLFASILAYFIGFIATIIMYNKYTSNFIFI